MRLPIHGFVVGLGVVAFLGLGASFAQAEKRLLEMTLVPGSSMMRVTGILAADSEFTTAEEPVELVPQKTGAAVPGEETFTGLSSDLAFFGESPNLPGVGTKVTVIYDDTNSRMQVIKSRLITDHSGNYCPGDGSDTPMNQTDLDESDGDFDTNEECPNEEPGSIAVTLGVPGAGSAELVVRDINVDMNGASDISPTGVIDSLNWHLFLESTFADIDGTGGFDYDASTNPDGLFPATHTYLHYPLRAGHNENDPGTSEVDESTYFKGSFAATGNPDEFELSFPMHVPAYFGNEAVENPDPEQYLAIVLESVDPTTPTDVTGQSVRGELQFRGTLGDTLLEGDTNMDGVVDGLDVNAVSAHWNKGDDPTHTHNPANNEPHSEVHHAKYGLWTEGDVDLSTIVDQLDMDIVVGNFGATAGAGAGSAATVPEPGGLMLAGMAMAVSLLASRRLQGNLGRRSSR